MRVLTLLLLPGIVLFTGQAYADPSPRPQPAVAPPGGVPLIFNEPKVTKVAAKATARAYLLAPLDPGMQCRAAIRAAERAANIPSQLMAAIARVESGRRGPDGTVNPWPWSINAEGTDHVYDSMAEAIAGVRALQAQGVRSIDVGCMQVNLMYHPDAFATLEQGFDPVANANYAAKFLKELYATTGNWERATAWYHSAEPERGGNYERMVAGVLPQELQRVGDTPGVLGGAGGNVWSANVWTSNVWAARGGGWPGQTNVLKPTAQGGVLATSGTILGNRPGAARLLPAAQGIAGRGLDAYRATPIALASRQVPITTPRPPL
jgi:hypothetical protein